jgi:predicted DNA-binding transcriptional regulator YafY
MTKSERLMYLVNMIRNRGPVLVNEMAAECGVSPRTIYRDMNSLMRLNFPIYYNNGYRLARDVGFPSGGLAPDEVELVCYALRYNPLSQHPFFKSKFRIIEQKINCRGVRSSEAQQGSLFLFEKGHEALAKSRESDFIATFIQAICERRKIILCLSDDDTGGETVVPVAIKLRQAEVYLVVTVDGKSVEERAVRDVKFMRLTDEKFINRPLALVNQGAFLQKRVDDA